MDADLLPWSALVAVVALDLGRTRIFRPLRGWVRSRSDKLGELVDCPWCLSHWLAGAVAVYRWNDPLDFFALMALATPQLALMSWLLWLLDERLRHD